MRRRPPVLAALAALLLAGAFAACGGDRGTAREPRPRDTPTTAPAQDVADSVVVLYATDRAPFEPTWRWYAARFAWAGGVLAVGLLLARRMRRMLAPPYRWRATLVRALALLAGLALAAQAAFEGVRMSQRSARLEILYGNERWSAPTSEGLPLRLGSCRVSIPPTHVVGQVEQPSLWRGDWFEDPRRHMIVHGAREATEPAWFEDLRALVRRATNEDAFVFVHGYNVTWEEAVLRTAQIAYDLGFDGAPISYSWPSQGGYAQYTVDEGNVRWSTPHLERFLDALRERSGARRIHLIAHSMGNRALTEALQRIRARRAAGAPPAFGEVVLAAPDVDADTFREDIAPAILAAAERTTLYASSHDAALRLSREVHAAQRAGEVGEGVVVVEGLDTVDVSSVSGSHSYIGDNGRVLTDLGTLLKDRLEAAKRPGLVPRPVGTLRYWFLEALGAK